MQGDSAPSNQPRPSNGKSHGRRDGKRSQSGKHAGRRPVTGPRHQSRMLALIALYEIDLTGHDVDEVIARTVDDGDVINDDETSSLPTNDPLRATTSDLRDRVRRLTHGVLSEKARIDLLISAAAPAFPLTQFSGVDRNVLRLATYEMLEEEDVPVSVAINEAVELAKRFGGDNSGRFVNGTLGTISERLGEPRRLAN